MLHSYPQQTSLINCSASCILRFSREAELHLYPSKSVATLPIFLKDREREREREEMRLTMVIGSCNMKPLKRRRTRKSSGIMQMKANGPKENNGISPGLTPRPGNHSVNVQGRRRWMSSSESQTICTFSTLCFIYVLGRWNGAHHSGEGRFSLLSLIISIPAFPSNTLTDMPGNNASAEIWFGYCLWPQRFMCWELFRRVVAWKGQDQMEGP